MRFDLPLSASDRADVIALLATDTDCVVMVGSCSLHVDSALEVIWGVDSFGNDRLASNAIGGPAAIAALDWAVAHNAEVDRRY